MAEISKIFNNDSAFIAYLTAGQKDPDVLLEIALSLVKGGVDIIEIGVPFSDPVADGTIIQRAMTEALVAKTTLDDALNLAGKIKEQVDIPLVLFSYYNPILQHLNKGFYKKARNAGIDGILVVDLPPEEAADHIENCKKNRIYSIFVITPSSTHQRIKKISKYAQGFLYYACRKGTTGIKNTLPADFSAKIANIKRLSNLPVVAGFGIASKESANKVIKIADGFVVGSLFVNAVDKGARPQELEKLARKIDPRGGK